MRKGQKGLAKKGLKKWLPRLVKCGLVLGIFGVVCLAVGNWYVKKFSDPKILSAEAAAEFSGMDCIMVLGCGLRPDGTPTQMLKDRLDQGIALYQSGVAPKLLMSGDHGRVKYDEVNKMKQYAIDQGVPSEDIFMDHAGFSTYESMYRSREVFQVERMIVVTQDYHLYRAVYNGNQLGVETYGVAARKVRYGGQWRRDLREILARNKDVLACMCKPKPTYLGEAIPVSGNGDDTNDGK